MNEVTFDEWGILHVDALDKTGAKSGDCDGVRKVVGMVDKKAYLMQLEEYQKKIPADCM